MSCHVAVVGATGLVGREMLRTLEARQFAHTKISVLASARSVGKTLTYRGEQLTVAEATPDAFQDVDIALFSAGRGVSRELAPEAASRGAVVIDNSNAWRMDPEVPLVVPEVNPAAIADRPRGIIANPNCSTIQMVVALQPIYAISPIRHVVVSTYQAVSGKGQAALDELDAQNRAIANGQTPSVSVFPVQIAQNLVMDWKPGEDGYSEEELKMVHETRKIMGDENIAVSPTAVRVPIATCHAESLHVRCEDPIDAEQVREAMRHAPGVVLQDDGEYAPGAHPQPLLAAGQDAVFVGRIRNDLAVAGAVNLWVVGDNLRKGAALNAVQIAELVLG
jgi:aspartate-semialdehyde dehydrogenase